MDVSVWWVVVAAASGLGVGLVLFAVLTMASDHDDDALPNAQGTTHTMV